MSLPEVDDSTFEQVVLRADQPVLVEYDADWCSPCKQQAPIVAELAQAYAGRMHFVRLDTGDNPITPATHFVKALPTLQIFRDGQLVSTIKGSRTKAMLIAAIEEQLPQPDTV